MQLFAFRCLESNDLPLLKKPYPLLLLIMPSGFPKSDWYCTSAAVGVFFLLSPSKKSGFRYLRRLYRRYCKQGDRGLVHEGRGRPSNRARSAEFKAAVLARYQERYPDLGPTLAARS